MALIKNLRFFIGLPRFELRPNLAMARLKFRLPKTFSGSLNMDLCLFIGFYIFDKFIE
ncbi:MAG: hypothetical protein J5680_07800 [Neisseriaceae bacterium]|nr:hypothetical protein [Neisseriaceae bacterium]